MKLTPSGASSADEARPASAFFMNEVQIGSAACAPLRPSGWLLSRPTHTTVSSSGVKPTNHASRRSLVVPVLPAASSVKPFARAPAAVPSLRTLRIMLVTRNVVDGFAMRRRSVFDFFVTPVPPRVMLAMYFSGRTAPPLGKIVYAVAISNGVASNTPSAIDGYGLGGLPTPRRFH